MTVALFRHYPRLAEALPHVPLGMWPTPVEPCSHFGEAVGANNLYMKREDLAAEAYGGNKVRKLEFILGDALRRKAGTVITFGYAGSNHALATAIFARQVGLRAVSMLLPQPNSSSVRRNLLAGHAQGADLRHFSHKSGIILATLAQCLRAGFRKGKLPYIIVPGGSSPLGACGVVSAAIELVEQIEAGQSPTPDRVYVPAGTMGTAVGLCLGFKAAGLPVRVVAVRVIEEAFVGMDGMASLYRKTNVLLNRHDPSFPMTDFTPDDVELRHDLFGERYGLYTPEGMEAVDLMARHEGVQLDGTYSGKCLAALVRDVRSGAVADQTLLFWNTYNSRAFPEESLDADYHTLPSGLHRYFESDVQPLDHA